MPEIAEALTPVMTPITTAAPIITITSPSEDVYQFDQAKGQFFMLAMKQFEDSDKDLESRFSCEKELKNMPDCFGKLGFKVNEPKVNLTAEDSDKFFQNCK